MISTNWLYDWWILAQVQYRESIWNSLPEDILEYIEKNSITVTNKNLECLEYIITNPITSKIEIISAIRLLGGIAEINNDCQKLVRPYFQQLLFSEYSYIRTLIIEAIWQSNDKELLPSLKSLSTQETNPNTIITLNHVISILERINT